MIILNGKEYRNLQEQVRKNKDDIEEISLFDIVGEVNTAADLPEVAEKGNVYVVGLSKPFEFYMYIGNGKYKNLGTLASLVPGPKGDKGDAGLQGERGSRWTVGTVEAEVKGNELEGDMYLDILTGGVYRFNGSFYVMYGSIKGKQGVPGPKGPTYDDTAIKAEIDALTKAYGPLGERITALNTRVTDAEEHLAYVEEDIQTIMGPNGLIQGLDEQKQDKLTAGRLIEIQEGLISSTAEAPSYEFTIDCRSDGSSIFLAQSIDDVIRPIITDNFDFGNTRSFKLDILSRQNPEKVDSVYSTYGTICAYRFNSEGKDNISYVVNFVKGDLLYIITNKNYPDGWNTPYFKAHDITVNYRPVLGTLLVNANEYPTDELFAKYLFSQVESLLTNRHGGEGEFKVSYFNDMGEPFAKFYRGLILQSEYDGGEPSVYIRKRTIYVFRQNDIMVINGTIDIPETVTFALIGTGGGKIDAADLVALMEGSDDIVVDLNPTSTAVEVHLDQTYKDSVATKVDLNKKQDQLSQVDLDNIAMINQYGQDIDSLEAAVGQHSISIENINGELKNKLDSVPQASASVLGGVKIGSGITITEDGTISAAGGGGDPYVLPQATFDDLGGVTAEAITDEYTEDVRINPVGRLFVKKQAGGGGGPEIFKTNTKGAIWSVAEGKPAVEPKGWESFVVGASSNAGYSGHSIIIGSDSEAQKGAYHVVLGDFNKVINSWDLSSTSGCNLIGYQLQENVIPTTNFTMLGDNYANTDPNMQFLLCHNNAYTLGVTGDSKIITHSPNGTAYAISVGDDGALKVEPYTPA